MSQIAYNVLPDALKAGTLADPLVPSHKRSYKNTTGAVVPLTGLMVALGSTDSSFKRLTGVTDKLLGVLINDGESNQGQSLASMSIPFGTTPDTDSWSLPDQRIGSVVRKGVVAVAVEGAVTAGLDCFVRIAAGSAPGVVGAFRADADVQASVATAMRVDGAVFLSSTTGAGIALVELDTPKVDRRPDFVDVVVGAEGGGSANAIDVVCTIKNPDGSVVTGQREVFITSVATTADKGDIAAATAAVGTLGAVQNPATGDNNAAMLSTAAGLFSFKISNDQVENNEVTIYGDNIVPRVLKLTFA